MEIREQGGATIAYLADYWGGLRIVDVSDPAAPLELGSLNESPVIMVIVVMICIVSTGPPSRCRSRQGADRFWSTSRPWQGSSSSMRRCRPIRWWSDSYDTIGRHLVDDPALRDIPQDVLVMGTRAYVPIWMGGLLVFELSNPRTLVAGAAQAVRTDQAFYKVEAAGWNLYVTEGQCGLRVFDTSEGGAWPRSSSRASPTRSGSGAGLRSAPSAPEISPRSRGPGMSKTRLASPS